MVVTRSQAAERKIAFLKKKKKSEPVLNKNKYNEGASFPKSRKLSIRVHKLSIAEIKCAQSDTICAQISSEKLEHSPYNLRLRKNKQYVANNSENIKINSSEKRIATINSIPSNKTLFNNCKIKDKVKLQVGHLVLAKMKSYSPWPARVMEIKKKKQAFSSLAQTSMVL